MLDSGRERRYPRSIFLPLMLIALGAMLLCTTITGLEIGWDRLFQLWPMFLVLGGLDALFQGQRLVNPLLFIGLGGIFLLANLGYLPFSTWEMIVRFWPVLIIALGLEIIMGHHSPATRTIGFVSGVLLVAALVWLVTAISGAPIARTERQSFPLDDATRATIWLAPRSGNLTIEGGATPGILLEGTAHLSRGERLALDSGFEDGRANLKLESTGADFPYPLFVSSSQEGWNFRLTSQVPLRLMAEVTVGDQVLDLQALQFRSFYASAIIGKVVILSPLKSDLPGDARLTLGELVLRVPHGASVEIKLNNVLAGVSLAPGFRKQGGTIYGENSQGNPKINLNVRVVLGRLRVEYLP